MHIVDIYVYVLDADKLFLLGLDTLTRLEILLDMNKGKITSNHMKWEAAPTRKNRQLYAECSRQILFTVAELRESIDIYSINNLIKYFIYYAGPSLRATQQTIWRAWNLSIGNATSDKGRPGHPVAFK